METNEMPPKSEWKNLSINQLYDLRAKMQDVYIKLARVGASFSSQYLKFLNEIDQLIKRAESLQEN